MEKRRGDGRAVLRMNPLTGELTGLRRGQATLTVTVNGRTAEQVVTVAGPGKGRGHAKGHDNGKRPGHDKGPDNGNGKEPGKGKGNGPGSGKGNGKGRGHGNG